jgi:hypothetical protein
MPVGREGRREGGREGGGRYIVNKVEYPRQVLRAMQQVKTKKKVGGREGGPSYRRLDQGVRVRNEKEGVGGGQMPSTAP